MSSQNRVCIHPGFKVARHENIMKTTRLVLPALLLSAFTVLAGGASEPISTMIVGGGSSHDFQRWFNQADAETLRGVGAKVIYTENTAGLAKAIEKVDVLYLSNNKPFEDQETKNAIFKHVASGKGLLLVHPALWHNWKDWPEYNRDLCGGGSRGHDRFGEFTVNTTQKDHPIMQNVPKSFPISDELYYFVPDPEGPGIETLATATSTKKQKTYPSVFVVKHPKARIGGITLGHDGLDHDHPAYKTILKNAFIWLSNKP